MAKKKTKKTKPTDPAVALGARNLKLACHLQSLDQEFFGRRFDKKARRRWTATLTEFFDNNKTLVELSMRREYVRKVGMRPLGADGRPIQDGDLLSADDPAPSWTRSAER